MTNLITAPTREIELPKSKAKIVFKEWLTKAESESAKEPLRRHEMEVTESKTTQRFQIGIMIEVEHLIIQKAVISINGSAENILETCLSLPEDDYDFLKKNIDDVISPPKEKKA